MEIQTDKDIHLKFEGGMLTFHICGSDLHHDLT